MGKNKLRKFAEMQGFPCVHQWPWGRLQAEGCPHRGRWTEGCFDAPRPLTLELGCGKGEYTVGMARRFPDRNFIGVDVKGARIYTGARQVHEEALGNAAFLRAAVEDLEALFAPGEVEQIWITFADPQMKHVRRRLTGARFLNLYRRVAAPGAVIHLKTDSPFLYTFTRRLVLHNSLELLHDCDDLYGPRGESLPDHLRSIKTFYEQQWLGRGKNIKYLAFRLPDSEIADPPEDDIPHDDYRAYPRGLARDPGLNL